MPYVLLFFLGLLIGNHTRTECPTFVAEQIEVYALINSKEAIEFEKTHQRLVILSDPNIKGSTTALSFFVGTTTSDGRLVIGTTTDKDAVEYNKRVKECQTANGEFTR